MLLTKPEPEESGFVVTLNNMGYMTDRLDPYSQKFIESIDVLGLPVLEIGAAYGIATLKALAKGSKVVANDLDARHLAILEKEVDRIHRDNLQLMVGQFPEEVCLLDNAYQAILMCRVAHFLDGSQFRQAVKRAYPALAHGGKFYLVAETPYLNNWKRFIPEYQYRKKQGVEWPGLIKNVTDFADKERLDSLPKLVHWFDLDILDREFKLAGFSIQEAGYINRDYFPSDIRLDGQESVGIIGVKA